ncbi:hypothetical protein DQ384_08670 [Sphaerisporangium album]|uniref:Uncharacterized protein n=1 Tax=Sphaerisporangium album TaxID=509200 RepID=A0A367FML3_9ACTN|nr:hypothetical protein [Sphaerisporangium album]RCG31626.1 hypothetical protein DQ384_08670 [Sphaerisporangium album]
MDLEQMLPTGDQHALLASRGFRDAFGALWIERSDLEEIAGLLGVDASTRRDHTLEQATAWLTDWSRPLGETATIWLGPHSPGWSVAIMLHPAGSMSGSRRLSAGERRSLDINWLWEVDGLYPLYYQYNDGEVSEEIDAFWDGYLPPGSVFEPFASGLVRDHGQDDGEEPLAHTFLTIVGRMTGRFIDEDWFRTSGRVYDLLRQDAQE